jgi:hypothetical protein
MMPTSQNEEHELETLNQILTFFPIKYELTHQITRISINYALIQNCKSPFLYLFQSSIE